MHALALLAPAAAIDALMDELDALSVSVEDSDADTPAEHALFGEPGLPPPSAPRMRARACSRVSPCTMILPIIES